MKTGGVPEPLEIDAGLTVDHDPCEFFQSNCCYSHHFPYFNEPVHPYDYSEDWDLEEEWNRKQDGLE